MAWYTVVIAVLALALACHLYLRGCGATFRLPPGFDMPMPPPLRRS